MFYVKRKHYAGRWIVKIVQAALIFGIVFYGLDFFGQMMESQKESVVVVESVQPEVQVITIERNSNTNVLPQLDEFDYFRLGFEHQIAGQYYDAIADYSQSLALDPNLAPSYLNRGVAYEQLDNNDSRAKFDLAQWMMRDNLVILTRVPLNDSANFTIPMSEGYRFDIPLNLNYGAVVRLDAVSLINDQVDPIMVLFDPHGRPIASNDDVRRTDGSLASMNSYISDYEVNRSGQYTLMVSHAGGGSYGDVIIRVTIDH